jgi:hypothetical protein
MGKVLAGIASSMEPAKMDITWEGVVEDVKSGASERMRAMRE